MPLNNLIKFRKGTSNEWINANPILDNGEPGWDTTNNIFKIGDGTSPWNELGSLNSKIIRGSFLLNQPSGSFTVDGGYTVGSLDIFLNGVKLSSSGDYTASNGTSFALSETAPSGSVIEYLALSPGLAFSFNTNDIINFNSSVSGLLPVTNILAGSNISIVPSGSTYTIGVSGSLGLTTEEVDDRVNNLLVAGSGINLSYNDESNTLTISTSGISQAEDTSIGSMLYLWANFR